MHVASVNTDERTDPPAGARGNYRMVAVSTMVVSLAFWLTL
jgi:hypothetical protein